MVVNPHQIRVISDSVKKTDRRDVSLLAQYLEKDLLPEVRQKTLPESEMAHLVSSRDQLVNIRTMLKNRLHGLLRSYGIHIGKQGLNSANNGSKWRNWSCPLWPMCSGACCWSRSTA